MFWCSENWGKSNLVGFLLFCIKGDIAANCPSKERILVGGGQKRPWREHSRSGVSSTGCAFVCCIFFKETPILATSKTAIIFFFVKSERGTVILFVLNNRCLEREYCRWSVKWAPNCSVWGWLCCVCGLVKRIFIRL